MDYERINKPSSQTGGGLSPSKLRAMLLGLDRGGGRRGDGADDGIVLRSHADNPRASAVESCHNVDVVSSATDVMSGVTALKPVEMDDCESSGDSESVSSGFEFQRASHHRNLLLSPFFKPAPSKWDDAYKWIASPTTNRVGNERGGKPPPAKKVGKQYGAKVVEAIDTKRIDLSNGKKNAGLRKAISWETTVGADADPWPVTDSGAAPALAVESSAEESGAIPGQHNSPKSLYNVTAVAPPTVKPVSMRDMGTEMTPIASQEPSRNGTPVGATTPARSPNTSRATTPERTAPRLMISHSADSHSGASKEELADNELQLKTRREIMALGAQLGKTNITAWASKEVEKVEVSAALRSDNGDESPKCIIEARAAAWEEAEKAKYLARFKREEIKIQAWEDHHKARTEAEMRKMEVEVEKMRACAQEKLVSKLAAARHKAEEKRAAAEARKNQQAARAAQQAEHIRKTGQVPSSFSFWSWCS